MRLVVGLTAVAGLAGAALFVATGRDVKESRPRADARSAGALIDSIGINVHFSYVDTAYARQADVLARLRELGVRHIRDATPNPVEALREGLRASRRTGVRATLLVDPAVDPAAAVADSLAVMGTGIAAFEGPNELDNSGDRGWPERLDTYMRALATAVRKQAPRVPLVGPSFIDAASRSHIPADLPGLFNGHPYPGGQPPEGAVEQALGERRATARERDVVFTETGYHNALAATTGQPAASEEAAGGLPAPVARHCLRGGSPPQVHLDFRDAAGPAPPAYSPAPGRAAGRSRAGEPSVRCFPTVCRCPRTT